LIDPKKRMAEHGCGIVQESRREDERDRMGLEVTEPAVKPFAGHLRQAGIVELQPFPQPVVPGDKGALGRLIRAPNEFLREELLERRVEFCLWVRLPIGRHEKTGVVLFAGVSSKQILSVMEQKMPLSLASESGLQTFVDQFDKIGILGRLTRVNRQGWKNKQNE
jgi:hypothetical protein